MKNNNLFVVLSRTLQKVIYVLVVVVLISFVASNDKDVELSLFPFSQTVNMPLFLVLLIVAAVAFIIGIVYNGLNREK